MEQLAPLALAHPIMFLKYYFVVLMSTHLRRLASPNAHID